MNERADLSNMLGQAEAVQAQIRRQGRWYPAWVAVYGLITVGIVTWVPVAHGSWPTAVLFVLLLLAWVLGLRWWKSHRPVHPVTDKQAMARWMAPWLVLYLLGVSWVGPNWLGGHVGWWALMGVVIALPAFVEAVRYGWRLRA